MKLMVFLVPMVGLGLGADWSCQQCRALSTALSQASSAQQDIQQQTQLLQAQLCPGLPTRARPGCPARLAALWPDLAPALWPAVFSPTEWCEEFCDNSAPVTETALSCQDCRAALAFVGAELSKPDTLAEIVQYGQASYCGSDSSCRGDLGLFLPRALPLLAGYEDPSWETAVCQAAFNVC